MQNFPVVRPTGKCPAAHASTALANGGGLSVSWTIRDVSGDDYDRGYEARAAAGQDVHGEANFVIRFEPRSVLDAGCGTGRIARELARRGVVTVGVDRDPRMLATAQRKAPDLDWRLADIATAELGGPFDAVLLAGNVMLFVDGGTEGTVLANIARVLVAGGHVIAGFQLGGRALTLEQYDTLAGRAGLEIVERWATWDRDPWQPGGPYAVSVHCKTISTDLGPAAADRGS